MQKGELSECEMSHWQKGVSLSASEQYLTAVDTCEGMCHSAPEVYSTELTVLPV